MKKKLKKVSEAEEQRRPDKLSDHLNSRLSAGFKKTEKISKTLKVIGFIVTAAFTVYGLIPKKDELPALDNQI